MFPTFMFLTSKTTTPFVVPRYILLGFTPTIERPSPPPIVSNPFIFFKVLASIITKRPPPGLGSPASSSCLDVTYRLPP